MSSRPPAKIEACPWCSKNAVNPVPTQPMRIPQSGWYYVWCEECGACGPRWALEHNAIAAWNRVARAAKKAKTGSG